MTDQPIDPEGAPVRGGRNDSLLLAIGETRAAAKAAAEASARTESAVSGLGQRVSRVEVDLAKLAARQEERDRAEAEKAQEGQAREARKTSPWTVAAVLISAIAVVVTVMLFEIQILTNQ